MESPLPSKYFEGTLFLLDFDYNIYAERVLILDLLSQDMLDVSILPCHDLLIDIRSAKTCACVNCYQILSVVFVEEIIKLYILSASGKLNKLLVLSERFFAQLELRTEMSQRVTFVCFLL